MTFRSGDSREDGGIPLILAHRGAAGERPENTLAAFRRALEVGADGIEFDVQLTKDGELVVIHDERLDRTTNGTGWVKDHTLAALQALDAGRWFSQAYREERIPLLAEVLALAAPACVINVELKNSRVPYPGIESKVIEALKGVDALGKTIVSSFNHDSLQRVKAIDPSARIGYLYQVPWRSPIARALQLGAEGIHPPRLAVSRRLVLRAHRAGLAVRAWTVNRPKHLQQMMALGVDAIMTDHPAMMREILRHLPDTLPARTRPSTN